MIFYKKKDKILNGCSALNITLYSKVIVFNLSFDVVNNCVYKIEDWKKVLDRASDFVDDKQLQRIKDFFKDNNEYIAQAMKQDNNNGQISLF